MSMAQEQNPIAGEPQLPVEPLFDLENLLLEFLCSKLRVIPHYEKATKCFYLYVEVNVNRKITASIADEDRMAVKLEFKIPSPPDDLAHVSGVKNASHILLFRDEKFELIIPSSVRLVNQAPRE